MSLHQTSRSILNVAAFLVDGANLSKRLGGSVRLDYEALTREVEARIGVPVRYRMYYTTVQDEASLKRRQPFLDHLKRSGWTVDVGWAKWSDRFARWADKGVDIAIALDAWKLAAEGHVSTLVVATGDEDFVSLFKRTRPLGVKGYALGITGQIAAALSELAEPILLDRMDGSVWTVNRRPAVGR